MLAAAALLSAAAAARSPAPPGRRNAERLATLFADACYDHPGNPAATRTVLRRPPFRPMPPARAGALLRRPGLAFEVPDDPAHPVVLSFDDGWCGAGAGNVGPRALTVALETAVRTRGGAMELMDAGVAGNEQHYLLRRTGLAPMVLLVLMQDRGDGSVQATLFADAMPDQQHPDAAFPPTGSPPP